MESQHEQGEERKSNGASDERRVHNRVAAVMAHTTRYAFKGQARLAADAGASEAAVSRLVNGRSHPSYRLVHAVARALGMALGRRLSPDEVVSYGGSYPTLSVCALAACRGCLPDAAYDEEERLRPEFRGIAPGEWSLPGRLAPATQLQALTVTDKEDL